MTVPKVIGSGETITIPTGRVAILPNVQIEGDLVIDGDVFVPSGATITKEYIILTASDNSKWKLKVSTSGVLSTEAV